jgi:hypothetical protein
MRALKGKPFRVFLALAIGLLGILAVQWGLIPREFDQDDLINPLRGLFPTPEPDEQLIQQARLHLEDLPNGWYYDAGTPSSRVVPDAQGDYYQFHHRTATDVSWIHIGEILLVYPDKNTAQRGYLEQRDNYILPSAADSWQEKAELQITHHADEMKIVCEESYLNEYHHYGCLAIGRYGRLVIIVLGNIFDDRWLTMEEFRSVLEAADRRAAATLGSQ